VINNADKLYLNQLKSSPLQKFLSDKQLTNLFKLFDKDNDGTITRQNLVKINAFIFNKFKRIGASDFYPTDESIDTETTSLSEKG